MFLQLWYPDWWRSTPDGEQGSPDRASESPDRSVSPDISLESAISNLEKVVEREYDPRFRLPCDPDAAAFPSPSDPGVPGARVGSAQDAKRWLRAHTTITLTPGYAPTYPIEPHRIVSPSTHPIYSRYTGSGSGHVARVADAEALDARHARAEGRGSDADRIQRMLVTIVEELDVLEEIEKERMGAGTEQLEFGMESEVMKGGATFCVPPTRIQRELITKHCSHVCHAEEKSTLVLR